MKEPVEELGSPVSIEVQKTWDRQFRKEIRVRTKHRQMQLRESLAGITIVEYSKMFIQYTSTSIFHNILLIFPIFIRKSRILILVKEKIFAVLNIIQNNFIKYYLEQFHEEFRKLQKSIQCKYWNNCEHEKREISRRFLEEFLKMFIGF